jgi:hypothetical protein
VVSGDASAGRLVRGETAGVAAVPPIARAETAEAAFIDAFADGPLGEAVRVTSLAEFAARFGNARANAACEGAYAVAQFFANGGRAAWALRVAAAPGGAGASPPALVAALADPGGPLERVPPGAFGVLVVPGAATLDEDAHGHVLDAALALCARRRAFLLVDIPPRVATIDALTGWMAANEPRRSPSAAVYFPRLRVPDPAAPGRLRNVGPSGTLAGVFARLDASRGFWRAPAGTEATLAGAAPATDVGDRDTAALNGLGVNALRTFPTVGPVAWGARTMHGADHVGGDWKYIPVRRTALVIEASIEQGLAWATCEPNAEPLWTAIRAAAGELLDELWRDGAFQGRTAEEAYRVRCDASTTTPADVAAGVANVVVGFAPLRPAEFVTVRIAVRAAAPAV